MCGRFYCGPDFSELLEELLSEIDAKMPEKQANSEEQPAASDTKAADTMSADEKSEAPGRIITDARDVFPSTEALTIRGSESGLEADAMRWGFTAPFDKKLLINARAETVRQKRTFSDSVEKRRCVIPTSGFYEWDKRKSRYRFYSDNKALLLLAGIYRDEPDGRKYTILTTEANDSMRPVHSRMPVIVKPEELKTWILDDSAYSAILTAEQLPLIRESDEGQLMWDATLFGSGSTLY